MTTRPVGFRAMLSISLSQKSGGSGEEHSDESGEEGMLNVSRDSSSGDGGTLDSSESEESAMFESGCRASGG